MYLVEQNVCLNNDSCMGRPIIDLNPLELKYYPSMINLNKHIGSCNVASPKICVPKEKKVINIKAFSMITNKNEVEAMAEHILCDCKCKLNSTTYNSDKKWNNITCQRECKKYHKCKKDYSWNLSTCKNSRYLKSLTDTSVTECDEIVIVIDNLSTKKTNVTGITLINYHSKKLR